MRKQWIECKNRNAAKRRAPWAACVYKACGGFWAFESVADAKIWKNQK